MSKQGRPPSLERIAKLEEKVRTLELDIVRLQQRKTDVVLPPVYKPVFDRWNPYGGS